MHFNNDQFNNSNDIVNAFAKYFSSVYENYDFVDTIHHNPPKILSSTLHSVSIDLIKIFESLNSLDSASSPGPDLIPNIFLRNCKYVISSPLAYLFNLSLSSGIFPDIWKTSFIRSIPKPSSDLSNITNYRPISLLSLIPKMFESLVANKILFELNNIIVDNQHGFRRNKSTITNLLQFQTFLSDALSNGSNVDVIYTNFTKAFDKINHHILFAKLKQIGVCDPFLSWLRSFVENSYQIVAYKEYWSTPLHVSSGVP